MGSAGQRRARKTKARKGKPMNLRTKQPRRNPEGYRHSYDEKGGFQMGSSTGGRSMCSRRGIDHWMVPHPAGGFCCRNLGCVANC